MKLSLPNKETFLRVIAVASLFLHATTALAQDITVVHNLDFGKIAIPNFSAVSRVTIEIDGSVTTNGNAYFHENPTRGEYQVTGGPPNMSYTVVVPTSVTLNGSGGTFIIDNFEIRPSVLSTNASGEDTFYITARMQTQGGGTHYYDGPYTSTMQITIAF